MAGETILRSIPPDLPVGREIIVPTVAIFDGTENLRILSASSVAVTLSIYVRMRRNDGTIDPMQFVHTPFTDRTVKTTDHIIGAGVMLNLVIVPVSGAPIVGETFVQASIIRGFSGATIPQGILAQDYATTRQPVAWPGGQLRRSTEGQGAIRSVVARSQTGGANIVSVPTGARWRIDSLTLQINANPSAGPNRQLVFSLVDAATAVPKWAVFYTPGQPIGTTYTYYFTAGAENLDMAIFGIIHLRGPSPMTLRAADQLNMNATNLDGLETLWIYATAEEWLEVA